MKIGTVIKLGALGIAAVTTAAGSVYLTTKALKKVSNESQPAEKEGFESVPPIPEAAPVIEVPEPQVMPKVEPVPAPEAVTFEELTSDSEEYTDVPMGLPYLAGRFGEEDADKIEIVIPPSEAKIEEELEPVVEEIPVEELIEEPVVEEISVEELIEEPVKEEIPVEEPIEEPVVEEIPIEEPIEEPVKEEIPVEEPTEEPVVEEIPIEEPIEEPAIEPESKEMETTFVEPEILVSNVAPIEESTVFEPALGTLEESDLAKLDDINPLEQGFAIGMAETDGETLPKADETPSFEDYSVLTEAEKSEEGSVTFEDLNMNLEYDEGTIPAVESITEAKEPIAEKPEPIIELDIEEALIAEDEPELEQELEVKEDPVVSEDEIVKIGDASVSDSPNNAAIKAVATTFNVPAENLASIAAEGNMPMVFEFLYSDMRTDATLMNVYFIMEDGSATLPPEMERENVLAFGRNFITGNDELKEFLSK